MFESKDDIVRDTIFTERVRTLLYLSMTLNKTIFIVMSNARDINNALIIYGIVYKVSYGNESSWMQLDNSSFTFVSDENRAIPFRDVFAMSFTNANDNKSFINKHDTLNRVQNLSCIHNIPYYKLLKDIKYASKDLSDDSLYYKIISIVAGADI